VDHHALDEHQSDIGFSQSDSVAQETTAIAPSHGNEVFVGVLLVFRKERKNDGTAAIPFIGAELVASQIFVQGLEPDFKGRARLGMALDDAENIGSNWFGLLPVALIPLLQQTDLGTGNPDIQLHIVA
jgi:hypothetical protein